MPSRRFVSHMILSIAHIGRFLDGMLHNSVVDDRMTAQRHRDFIAIHLGFGFLGLAAIPVLLTVLGSISAVQALTFSWPVFPLAIAGYLSTTGRLESAFFASAAALTLLIAWLAGLSGGLESPVLIWLALVPFAALLSARRRIVVLSVAIALAGLGVLVVAVLAGVVDAPVDRVGGVSSAAIAIGAVLCAGGLALRIERTSDAQAISARQDEAHYRQLVENSTDLITLHAENGDVEYASPAAVSMIGVTSGALLGEGLFRRVQVADRPAFLKALSAAYMSSDPTTVAFRLLRTDGTGNSGGFVPVEMHCQRMAESDATVVATIRDVSKATEQESALRLACDEAGRANRAKSRYFAHLNHELRTPLNAILGFSEILSGTADDENSAARRHEYAGLVHSAGQHLLQIVNGVLDTAKIEAGMFNLTLEPMRLAPLIAGCCEILGRTATERHVEIIPELSDDLPEILADCRACRQIVLNLLSNAIKFSTRGGSVTIGARAEGELVAIFVRDTGIGIAAKDLPHMGTPFAQGDTPDGLQDEGTGLGLSTVKALTTLHGGRLAIESNPGSGTMVTAYLPIDRYPDRQSDRISGLVAWPGFNEKERKSA